MEFFSDAILTKLVYRFRLINEISRNSSHNELCSRVHAQVYKAQCSILNIRKKTPAAFP